MSGSELPLGAGLGSSAAFCVAMSAALLHFSKELNFSDQTALIQDPECRIPDDPSLYLVNRWAFAAETLLHGTPSGIDNSVSTFGQALLYNKNEKEQFQLIKNFPKLVALVTNTGIRRDTRKLVEKVKFLREELPSVVNKIFDSISNISITFYDAINSSKLEFSLLDRLVEINHNLLRCLGVSHPEIESIREKLDKKGITTKLTGAGGGGCTLSFFPRDMIEIVRAIEPELHDCGFSSFISEIGGVGVTIHTK